MHELGYFTVATIDPQKASTFYGALFGWRTEAQGDGVHVANTKIPFGIVSGWKPEWGPGYGKGSITHWVSVPDRTLPGPGCWNSAVRQARSRRRRAGAGAPAATIRASVRALGTGAWLLIAESLE